MKEFYDSKLADETIDESNLRLIEQLRTEKHTSL
jgi:hypothetical protein